MRLFGQKFRCQHFRGRSAAPAALFAVLFASAGLLPCTQGLAQTTAPYVIPYTMSTYAGGHAAYTAGAACATNSKLVALNTQGDGCPALSVSVGTDPHDVRVDNRGNVFYIDNASQAVVHKINPVTSQQTVYVGVRTCATESDTYGDGCPANDGAANNNTGTFPTSSKIKAQRGLAIALNGDLFTAGYNDYEVHKISAATGIFSIVAGNGASGSNASGSLAATSLGSLRGVGVDAAGNVYIADTANNIIQEVIGGQIVALTGGSTTSKTLMSGVPATSVSVNAPEDVKIDKYGNIFIADYGNFAVRAIYVAGTLPGISNPIPGYIYTIAGSGAQPSPPGNSAGTPVAYTYPTDGSSPTVSPTSVSLQIRKLSVDNLGNVYLADSTFNVVWFIDGTSGNMRLLAGHYGGSATVGTATVPGQPATGCAAATASGSTIGDGCAGVNASIYAASDMGVDADNQGNLYITDAEGGSNTAPYFSRIRKLLSGLNFPAVTLGSATTQIVRIHFAPGDTPAASGFTVTGAGFAATTPAGSCTMQADKTYDCLVNVTFTPTAAGYQTATLTITSAAGATNTYLLTGTGSGPSLAIDPGYVTAMNTSVSNAQGVTADLAGNLYIVDTGHNQVLRYNATTAATTAFAGNGTAGFSGDNGPATAATLRAPTAVAVDTAGSVYITDTGNNLIRRVSNGVITTFAGGAGTVCAGHADALGDVCPATQATLSGPTGITTDNYGQIYVADSGNNVIRQIGTDGFIYALAGGATAVCAPPTMSNPIGSTDTAGDGCSATQTIFNAPYGLAFDPIGSYLVVADSGNNIVRRIYLANTFSINPTTNSPASAVAQFNPVSLIAGTEHPGSSVDTSGAAAKSELNGARGVAVDAAEDVLIADTGNSAVRFVNASTGTITTIIGVLGTAGTGTVPGSASAVALTSPASLALTGGNNLYIADSGNNRILSDNRSQVSFNFGRINEGTTSPTAVFTETNTGSATETLPMPFDVMSGSTDFSLTAPSSSVCNSNGTLTSGASCMLNGAFTPTTGGSESATFTETNAIPAGLAPSITLTGIGAVLTNTTSTLAQTSPASGNPQFGTNFTLTATVTAQACNTTGAPACYPTGTVTFTVDGNTVGAPVTLSTPGSTTATAATASQIISGLSTGTHTAACIYSGDNFYGASSCGSLSLTVAQATTTSVLKAATTGLPQYPGVGCFVIPSMQPNSGDTQCTGETLTATLASSTAGVPTGSVTFSANGATLGTATVSSTGVASLSLIYLVDKNGLLVSDNTLPVGSYNLTCTYTGSTNYAQSSCAVLPFTVVAQTVGFTLTARACPLASLPLNPGFTTALEEGPCTNGTAGASAVANPTGDTNYNGIPEVATADGSTTDATIFINPSTTLSGTVTIGCSGLPQYSICTFSPSVLTLSASTGFPISTPIDVTLWTDIRPGNATSAVHAPNLGISRSRGESTMLAMLLGWPVALLGIGGLVRSRKARRTGTRVLPWLAALLVMVGSTTALTGCGLGGPGVDQVVLTPAGIYPITITIKVGSITQSTLVYFKVSSPGIAGQE